MNINIEKLVKEVEKNKKRIIKAILIFGVVIISLGVASGVTIYSIAKSNINYTEEQAKEIALNLVPGEVIRVRKSLDLEYCTFNYEIRIKDNNNLLREVDVDSNLGVITDYDIDND